MKYSRGALALAAAAVLLCSLGCHGVAVAPLQSRNATQLVHDGHDGVQVMKVVEEVSPDYNEETYVGPMPVSVEMIFAFAFVALVGSVPFVLVVLIGGGNMTKAHIAESVALVVWLLSAIFAFTQVLYFNSAHWSGSRPLTIVEAVYLLSQILTTVGYGDITPAFPRSQVWVAFNVILALCLYGSIIMECTELIGKKVQAALDASAAAAAAAAEAADAAEGGLSARSRPLKNWSEDTADVSLVPFLKSLSTFLFAAFVGVLFYHFYPGEGKTWLQAVYMSVITLSTVGFGFFNATTEAGKVFGAFWMLFGVATLAATISSFVEYMEHLKAKQRKNTESEKLNFYRYIGLFSRADRAGLDRGMDSYDFMKFGLVLNGILSEEEVAHIEARFEAISGGKGTATLQAVHDAEAPPQAFADKHEAAVLAEGGPPSARDP